MGSKYSFHNRNYPQRRKNGEKLPSEIEDWTLLAPHLHICNCGWVIHNWSDPQFSHLCQWSYWSILSHEKQDKKQGISLYPRASPTFETLVMCAMSKDSRTLLLVTGFRRLIGMADGKQKEDWRRIGSIFNCSRITSPRLKICRSRRRKLSTLEPISAFISLGLEFQCIS